MLKSIESHNLNLNILSDIIDMIKKKKKLYDSHLPFVSKCFFCLLTLKG